MIELVTISLIILYLVVGGVGARVLLSGEEDGWPSYLIIIVMWPLMAIIAAAEWAFD